MVGNNDRYVQTISYGGKPDGLAHEGWAGDSGNGGPSHTVYYCP